MLLLGGLQSSFTINTVWDVLLALTSITYALKGTWEKFQSKPKNSDQNWWSAWSRI